MEQPPSLAFAPCLAPFVMGFSDVNAFGLRDESNDDDHIQALVSQRTFEDARHWPIFLDDLEALGLNAPTVLTTALRDPQSVQTRAPRWSA